MKDRAGKRQPAPYQGLAPRLVCYATRSGGTTLDQDAAGGNPFASALIEAAGQHDLQLSILPTRLHELTAAKSYGHQFTEGFGDMSLPNWSFRDPAGAGQEWREALVLVVSDYSGSSLGPPLLGAARDERRIAVMLAQYGFSVIQGIGPSRSALTQALASFGRRSLRSEIGVLYSTGHGVELDGEVYLLPADYPLRQGFEGPQLKRHAVSVTQMARAACALNQNIIFFAGCRTHVLPHLVLPPNDM